MNTDDSKPAEDGTDAERLGAMADAIANAPHAAANADVSREGRDDDGDAVERAARALSAAGLSDPSAIDAALSRVRSEASNGGGEPEFPADYEVLDEIGRGGGGVVYRAKQRSLGRLVALKMLHADGAPGGLFGASIERFEREARALARLSHPGIVAVFEVGSTRGRLWYAMELVEGTSLATRLRRKPMEAREAAKLLRDVADAVAYVHEHGLVHRDLKPGNVLLGEGVQAGRVVVTDFGLALEVGDGATGVNARDGVTLTGQVIGTPAYMAPEQARGDGRGDDAVGPATDVYALGAILYEALSGHRAFEGLSPPEQVYAAIHQEPRSVARAAGRGRPIPDDLVRVVEKAMRKRPRDRYPTARALVEDLDRVLAGEPVTANPRAGWRRVGSWARRHPTLVAGGIAALLALALVAVVATPWVRDRARVDAFVEAADDAAAHGDPETAIRLFARASDAAGGKLGDAVRLRAAEAEVPLARQWIDAGRAKDVIARIAGDRVPIDHPMSEGPLRWARALAWAAIGARGQAESEIHAAFDAWNQARFRLEIERVGGMDARHDHEALSREQQAAALAWLPVASPAGRGAAWFEFHHIPLTVFYGGGAERFAEAAARDPRTLVAAIEAESASPGGGPSRLDGFWWWMKALASHRTASMEEALAAAARDGSRSASVRGASAALLAGITDLPLATGFSDESGQWFDRLDSAPVVALWEKTKTATAAESLRLRLDAAVARWRESPSTRAESDGLSSWFSRHTPDAPREREAAIAWWTAHRGDDLVPAFATAAGLSAGGPVDPKDAINRWWDATDAQRDRLQQLLLLLAPPGADVPILSIDGRRIEDVVPRWRVIFGAMGGPYRLRIAKLVWSVERGWHLDGPERRLDLDVGTLAHLHEEGPIPSIPSTFTTFAIPGAVRSTNPVKLVIDVDATLQWKPEGLTVAVPRVYEMREGPGGSAGGGGNGNSSLADTVFSPDLRIEGGSTPDPRRNEFFLAVVEPRDADATPWTLDAWRARVVIDLMRLAETIEAGSEKPALGTINRAILDRQEELYALVGLAALFPVPGAAPALARLDAAVARVGDSFFDRVRLLIPRARLLAGDVDLLATADPLAVSPRSRSELDPFRPPPGMQPTQRDALGLRRDAQAWIRTLCDDVPPALRALALNQLAGLTFDTETAGDLLDAVRAGRVEPTPALRKRLDDGPTDDRSFLGLAKAMAEWSVGAVLVDLALLVALVFACKPRRRPGAELVPCAWLVVLGVLSASVSVVIAGVDLLPDCPALALAAFGAASLAGRLRGRARWTTAIAFAVAAAVSFVPAGGVPLVTALFGPIAIAVGVAWLPRLAFRLRGTSAWPVPASRAPQPVVWILVLAAILMIAAGLLLGATGLYAWTWLLLLVPFVAVVIVVIRAQAGASGSASTRPWSAVFVVAYVLPVGAMLLGSVVSFVSGGAFGLTIRGTWTPALFMLLAVATLSALGAILGAARVRAAWERAKASGSLGV